MRCDRPQECFRNCYSQTDCCLERSRFHGQASSSGLYFSYKRQQFSAIAAFPWCIWMYIKCKSGRTKDELGAWRSSCVSAFRRRYLQDRQIAFVFQQHLLTASCTKHARCVITFLWTSEPFPKIVTPGNKNSSRINSTELKVSGTGTGASRATLGGWR